MSSKRSGVAFAVVLGFWLVPGGPAVAGPPLEDLPDVKMPALRAERPRLIFRPDGSGWPWTFARLKQLYETNEQMRSILKPWLEKPASKDPSPAASALRYRLTGDEAAAERAISQLLNRPWEKIGSEYYSNGWEYALAYDWLYDHPSITDQKRRKIEAYLVGNAKRALALLNDESWQLEPSLWHGRTKITNLALVVALSLEVAPEAEQLRRQIARFFGDACRALRLSEGWPEGYAYWLGNRSLPFALAVDCWRTATGRTSVAGIDLIEMIRRTDYWHVYGMRPDNKFLLYGDVFQGVLINYGYRAQTMDYYARLTGDPILQAFALHGHRNAFVGRGKKKILRPYYDRMRWLAALAFDPTLPLPEGSTPAEPLAGLKDLPPAALFGAGAYNLAIFRTGFEPDSTMVSLRAGAVQVHHAHYNAGAFTIFKRAPLAILSGTYAGSGSQHRQMYYIRSVAANCPLILAPGERLATRRHYNKPTASTGGQRLVIPGGSDVASAAQWRRDSQPGKEFAAGLLIAFASQPRQFGYVAADLTCAYNSTLFAWPGQLPKVRRVVRALVYLQEPETVLVFDRVAATSARYQKKWLLHTINKPACRNTTVLRGSADDGILATSDRDLTISNGDGRLAVQALLPDESRWLLVGGPNHRFYVETDGDQSDGFDGINAGKRFNKRSYFDAGNWRAELEPTQPNESHDFLVAMAVGTAEAPPRQEAAVVGRGPRYVACQVGQTIVIFADLAGTDRVVTGQLTPAGPVSTVVACGLIEPRPIAADCFEPVPPPRCASSLRLDKPLPAGLGVTVRLDLTDPDRMRIALSGVSRASE